MTTKIDRYNALQQLDAHQAQAYVIMALLRSTVRTAELVVVDSVDADAKTIQCTPLVLDVTTGGVSVSQSPIYGVPYFRVQGGTSAVIIDPRPGDIGLVVVASRDTSAVIAAGGAAAAPATDRAYSTADAFYVAPFLNGTPTQYIEFAPDGGGIRIVTPGQLDITASKVTHNGSDIGATHTHGGVTAGSASTDVPDN
jgi:hypothetical protein